MKTYRAVFCFLMVAGLISSSVAQTRATKDSYGKVPLGFEANQGQSDPRVKFLSRGNVYAIFLTDNEAVLSLPAARQYVKSIGTTPATSRPRPGRVARMKLLGANRNPSISAVDALPGKSNYFIGNDPSKISASPASVTSLT